MKAYLDYAATTPVDPEVLEKTLPCLTENFGNPDSLHAYGRTAAYALSEARDRVAHTLGVRPSEIYFTSGGTEADNWAVRMLGGGRVCVSAVEHRAVLAAAELCEGGMSVLPVLPSGIADVSALGGLPSDTGMVCVMAVNNETGCVQPIGEISEYCRARGILFFSDCVQAAGSCDLKETAKVCDAFSLSAHKIYGLKGTGALVVKKGVKLRPFVAGGEQERGLRGGTPNVAGIVAFSYALEKAQELREEILSIVSGWLDKNFEGILEEYREAFRQPEDYISVKLMFQQCIEHYVYERPFTDYGNENGILSGSLEEIEKSVVAGLFRKIIKDCAIVGGGAGDKLNLYH